MQIGKITYRGGSKGGGGSVEFIFWKNPFIQMESFSLRKFPQKLLENLPVRKKNKEFHLYKRGVKFVQ